MVQAAVLMIFPLAMIAAAASDLFRMTIPNRLSVALIFSFLPSALLVDLPMSLWLMHAVAGLCFLSATFVLFSLGWVGGGDAKIAAVAALWLGPISALEFALVAAVFGGILTLALLAVRAVPLPMPAAKWSWATRLHHPKTGIPYGIALGAAAVVVYPSSPFWQTVF